MNNEHTILKTKTESLTLYVMLLRRFTRDRVV